MQVSALTVYPVKSCAGIDVTSWPLDLRGLRHDRSFMVVDADGTFLTQREFPRLALVQPRVDAGRLTVTAPGHQPVTVDLHPRGAERPVTVWEFSGSAVDVGEDAARLFSRHLGVSVRLVAVPPEWRREADPHYAGSGDPIGFADGFPLLLTNESSLADLNARMEAPLPMRRFRPNLVVSGAPAYAEDDWHSVKVGGLDIDVVKACARCTITTVDPQTGLRSGAEPLRTLGTYRRGERGVLFGQNAVPKNQGLISVGDPVSVID